MAKLDDLEKINQFQTKNRASTLELERKILDGACGFCGEPMRRDGAYPPKIYNPTGVPPGEAMCKFCWERAEAIHREAQKSLIGDIKNL